MEQEANSLSSNKETISKEVLAFLRKRLYRGLIFAIILITIDAIASKLSLYWVIKWFDIPMHIAGGLLAAYFGIFIANIIVWKQGKGLYSKEDIIAKTPIIFPALIFAIVVGISWEILEAWFDLSGLDIVHRGDTIFDLINDTFGGFLAILEWNLLVKNKK